MMDVAEIEESLFAASDAKLHREMCKTLSIIYCKILSIFPTLEAARPRSKFGLQSLCSLHVALEKSKTVLQHCSECSKLYLAITGDSVVLKFEKAKSALKDSLQRVEDIVPQSIGCQIEEIISDLEASVFSLDPLEKQIGDELIGILQQGKKFNEPSDTSELESFHEAATKLGITSSRAALAERRALKKLIERSRSEEDKRKESIVTYLLHLLRKYSKLFRSEVSDDNDSQDSSPCSPTVVGTLEDIEAGVHCHSFNRQLSKLSSFNLKPNNRRSGQMPHPPEELKCPISLQLMCDPVIIASGQTYERICIEKWFGDGHNTCPKTQQQLPHLSLTPNYSVKGLVASWCEQHDVPVPGGPPESLDLNYWRLAISEFESGKSKSVGSVNSDKLKGVKVVPLEENGILAETEGNEPQNVSEDEEISDDFGSFITVLNEESDMKKQCRVVEKIRFLLKDDEESRIFMGANGFVEALLKFLQSAVDKGDEMAQESGAMALFNLAVNNNRNKEIMLGAGVISLLEEMISDPRAHECATALFLNISCLEKAKPIIGMSPAVPFLIHLLTAQTEPLCKLDALHTLYNLSTCSSNIPNLLSAGITPALQSLLANPGENARTEKCLAVLTNLASGQLGREDIMSTVGLISCLAAILDIGEPIEQEQAVSCLLILCNRSEDCCQMVLQEGVIPALVSISANGTSKGRDKSQKLLMFFREQRHRDHSPVEKKQESEETCSSMPMPAPESKPMCKSLSKRKIGKALSFLRKSKSYSVYKS